MGAFNNFIIPVKCAKTQICALSSNFSMSFYCRAVLSLIPLIILSISFFKIVPRWVLVLNLCALIDTIPRLLTLLIVTGLLKLSVKSFGHVGNPRSLIYGGFTGSLLCLFIPGLTHIFMSLVSPGLCQLMILLSGDVQPNPGPVPKLKVMFTNVNSLMAEDGRRFNDLQLRMKVDSIDIVCISEAGNNLKLSECNIDGYHALNDVFYDNKCRGLLIYVKESVEVKRRYDLETADGCIWLECGILKTFALLGVFYRSPSQTSDERNSFFQQMDTCIDKVLKTKSDIVLFGGDFNARSKSWWAGDINTCEGGQLYDLSVKHSLAQFIDQPTRITRTSKSCLDLIFCNYPGFVLDSEVTPPISLSDHSCTLVTLDVSTIPTDSVSDKYRYERTFWKFGQTDLNLLNDAVRNNDWDAILSFDDIDEMACSFVNSVYSVLCNYIPHVKRIVRANDMPWFDFKVRRAINFRNKCYRKMVKNPSEANHMKYRDSAARASEAIKKAKSEHHQKLCKSLDSDTSSSKNYWYIIKKLLGKKFSTGVPTMTRGDIVYSSCQEKCQVFLETFQEKFHHDYDESVLPPFHDKCANMLDSFQTTEEEVRTLLLELNVSKQGGDDGISNRMLKMIANPISAPLCRLFNRILQCGVFPSCWKRGILVPIYKNKGSKSSVANYRPVTLLNSLSKVLEKIVFKRIFDHFITNNLFYKYQSGFMPGHGTEKQLVSICHMIQSELNSGCAMRGIFLDIAGAFDAVPHFLLLHKLQAYGVTGILLQLLDSYLDNRCFRVKVDDCLSQFSTGGFINSGVPQGSLLGPLLFLIYINDLNESILNGILYLYADDSSIFYPVKPGQESELTNFIQDDLDRLAIWSDIWKLEFKACKSCEVVFCSPRKKIGNFSPVCMKGEVIPKSASHKHLGVILDEHLSFEAHIQAVVVKCNQMLNPLIALKASVRSKHLEQLYKCFILPHLEFGAIVFDSANLSFLAKLDQVHYRAALLVSGCMRGTSAIKVLKCVDWATLDQRRSEKKLVLMYDVTNFNAPSYVQDIFQQYRNVPAQRVLRHHRDFVVPVNTSVKFRKSTVFSSITLWENLPSQLKNCVSRNSFKYSCRIFCYGRKNLLTTSRLDLNRTEEITFNRVKCDLIFKNHLFSHNFPGVLDPACPCGARFQSTKHLLFECPLFDRIRDEFFVKLGLLPGFDLEAFNYLNVSSKMGLLLYGDGFDFPIREKKIILKLSCEFISRIVEGL